MDSYWLPFSRYTKKMKKTVLFFITIIIGISLTFLILFLASKEAARNQEIEKEIETFKQEAEKIKRNNLELEEKISYFETLEYQEKIAKEKLNLQKEGENVVIVKPVPEPKENEIQDKIPEPAEEIKLPVYKKWWNYFFGSN